MVQKVLTREKDGEPEAEESEGQATWSRSKWGEAEQDTKQSPLMRQDQHTLILSSLGTQIFGITVPL